MRRKARASSSSPASSVVPPRRAPGGWVKPEELPKSADGRPLCRRCQQEIPRGSGRRTFCSEACVTEWKIRTQPDFAAELVGKRDRGVCAVCALDCELLWRRVRTARPAQRRARCERLGVPLYLLRRRRYWEVDHITPVVEGGGSCGLENLRTLCWACHKSATRELAARRATAGTAASLQLGAPQPETPAAADAAAVS